METADLTASYFRALGIQTESETSRMMKKPQCLYWLEQRIFHKNTWRPPQ